MTILRSVQVVVCAGALAIGTGCSKGHEEEGTAAPEPEATEGSEMSGMDTTSSADTTELETQRMEESSRESSAAKTTDDKPMQGAPLPGETMPSEGATGTEAASTVSDSEIAFITEVVNNGEIEQAQVATKKAGNPQVKRFAQHMISEHRKANQAGAKVVKQAKIIPQESAPATKIEDDATGVLESLRSTDPGEGFDRLYIESQVMQHQKVLDMLDRQLIPSAENPELEAELTKSRAMVERHLTQAREIQQSMVD